MLDWWSEYGDMAGTIEQVTESYRSQGKPLPKWIADKPEIKPCNATLWMCWNDLQSDRQVGMGMGPVPWSSVMAWCDRRNLSHPAAEWVWWVIKQVDAAYLKKIYKDRDDGDTHQHGSTRSAVGKPRPRR